MLHLCFLRNFSGADSLIFYCTTWCPDTCKENFLSAEIPKNALLNEWPLAFETAFFVIAAVTAFIICLNTKKERVIKAHWWLDLRVALYSRIKMLKPHTFFKSVKIILVRFANAVLPNRTCLKKTCETCKPDLTQTFDLLLPTSIFCYAARTFARLEIICITLMYV